MKLKRALTKHPEYNYMTNLNFSTFPILTTERLTLRQLSVDDKQDVFALRSDPEVNRYLDRQPCTTTEDAINFINRVNENIEKKAALYWAITLTESRTFAGTICLFGFSGENNSCEIGYELMAKFQKQGIMKEAAQAIIDYVFRVLGCRTILAFTHAENLNSTRLLTKFNFVQSTEPNNENPDLNMFTLTQ